MKSSLADLHHSRKRREDIKFTQVNILHGSRGYLAVKMDKAIEQAVIKRLARAEGQLKGIQRMVKEQRYCVDIIQQVAASKKALEQVGLLIMRNHIDTCVSKAIRSKDGEGKISELMHTIHRFIR